MNEAVDFRFAGEPQGAAYEAWREEFCRKVLAADVWPIDNEAFEYEISPVPLTAHVKMSTGTGSALYYRTLARDDHLVLILPRSTRLDLKAGKRQTLLEPGMVGINDAGHHGAEAVQCDLGTFASIIFDRKRFIEYCPGVEDLIARPIAIDHSALRLLRAYMGLVRRQAASLNAASANIAAQHLFDLALLALTPSCTGGRRLGRNDLSNTRFEVLKADILSAISNPQLDMGTFAKRHRLSVRYIQHLFEKSGTSFSEFVLEHRLLLSLRLLRSPAQQQRKISEIALLAGFNSISYFHRAFRSRFGRTPAELREEMKG